MIKRRRARPAYTNTYTSTTSTDSYAAKESGLGERAYAAGCQFAGLIDFDPNVPSRVRKRNRKTKSENEIRVFLALEVLSFNAPSPNLIISGMEPRSVDVACPALPD